VTGNLGGSVGSGFKRRSLQVVRGEIRMLRAWGGDCDGDDGGSDGDDCGPEGVEVRVIQRLPDGKDVVVTEAAELEELLRSDVAGEVEVVEMDADDYSPVSAARVLYGTDYTVEDGATQAHVYAHARTTGAGAMSIIAEDCDYDCDYEEVHFIGGSTSTSTGVGAGAGGAGADADAQGGPVVTRGAIVCETWDEADDDVIVQEVGPDGRIVAQVVSLAQLYADGHVDAREYDGFRREARRAARRGRSLLVQDALFEAGDSWGDSAGGALLDVVYETLEGAEEEEEEEDDDDDSRGGADAAAASASPPKLPQQGARRASMLLPVGAASRRQSLAAPSGVRLLPRLSLGPNGRLSLDGTGIEVRTESEAGTAPVPATAGARGRASLGVFGSGIGLGAGFGGAGLETVADTDAEDDDDDDEDDGALSARRDGPATMSHPAVAMTPVAAVAAAAAATTVRSTPSRRRLSSIGVGVGVGTPRRGGGPLCSAIDALTPSGASEAGYEHRGFCSPSARAHGGGAGGGLMSPSGRSDVSAREAAMMWTSYLMEDADAVRKQGMKTRKQGFFDSLFALLCIFTSYSLLLLAFPPSLHIPTETKASTSSVFGSLVTTSTSVSLVRFTSAPSAATLSADSLRARVALGENSSSLQFRPLDGSQSLQAPLSAVKAVLVGVDSLLAKRLLTAPQPATALTRLSAGADIEDEPTRPVPAEATEFEPQMNRCMTVVTVVSAAAAESGLLSPSGTLGSPGPSDVPTAKLYHVVFDSELECRVWAAGLNAVLQAENDAHDKDEFDE
jgi:hypothetical protein